MQNFVNYVTKIQSTQRALWVFIRRSGALCAKCPGASGAARYAGETISLKEKQCGGERLHRIKKPPGISQSQGVTACQKSLAEFAARRRQINGIIFCRGVYLAKNTSQSASVEFVRFQRTNYARGRLQAFCPKRALPFLDSLPPQDLIAVLRGSHHSADCFSCSLRSCSSSWRLVRRRSTIIRTADSTQATNRI